MHKSPSTYAKNKVLVQWLSHQTQTAAKLSQLVSHVAAIWHLNSVSKFKKQANKEKLLDFQSSLNWIISKALKTKLQEEMTSDRCCGRITEK